MEGFHPYTPEDTVLANLEEAARRFDLVCEQELAHLQELATEITAGFTGNPGFADLLSYLRLPPPVRNPDVPEQNTDRVYFAAVLRSTYRRVILCMNIRRILSETYSLTWEFFFSDPGEMRASAYHRIATQKSTFTDAAFLRFSTHLEASRISYTHSFTSACEDVFNGICEFCLLPVDNSSEGRLNSFSRLIAQYELKIAATCDIAAADGTRTTRFALLRRELRQFRTANIYPEFLELSVRPEGYPGMEDLLIAARLCGLKLDRIDSMPQDGLVDRFDFHPVFSVCNADLASFLLYLKMEMPHCETVGLFPHLERSANESN